MGNFEVISQYSSLISINGRGNLFNFLKKRWDNYGEVGKGNNYIKLNSSSKESKTASIFLYTDEPGFFVRKIKDNFVLPHFYLMDGIYLKNQLVIFENGIKGIVGSIPPHYLKKENIEKQDFNECFIDPLGKVNLNMVGIPLIETIEDEEYIYGQSIARSSILAIAEILLAYKEKLNYDFIAFAGQTPMYIETKSSFNFTIKPLESKTGKGIIFETGYVTNRKRLKDLLNFAQRWNLNFSTTANYYLTREWENLMKNKGAIIYLPVENLNTTYEKISTKDLYEISKFLILYGLELS